MLFNSFKFWIVFALVFAAYWIIPARAHWLRKLYLVVVSYALYMNWQPSFALVLFFVTLVTYVGARVIGAIDTRMAADKSGGGEFRIPAADPKAKMGRMGICAVVAHATSDFQVL